MTGDVGEAREQKRERQTTEIYAALGRYVEAFEFVVFSVRTGCILFTSPTTSQHRLMQVVFNHRSMTAENLFRIYRALVAEIANDKDTNVPAEERSAIYGVLQAFDRDFQSAVSWRNDLLHGTWFVGWGSSETDDWSKFVHMRFKTTNDGLAVLPGPKSATDLDVHTQECQRLSAYIQRLNGCILLSMAGEKPSPVSANFINAGTDKRPDWKIRSPKN